MAHRHTLTPSRRPPPGAERAAELACLLSGGALRWDPLAGWLGRLLVRLEVARATMEEYLWWALRRSGHGAALLERRWLLSGDAMFASFVAWRDNIGLFGEMALARDHLTRHSMGRSPLALSELDSMIETGDAPPPDMLVEAMADLALLPGAAEFSPRAAEWLGRATKGNPL